MFSKKKDSLKKDISPDEIFLDSKNTPGFNRESFEGIIERAIISKVPVIMMVVFFLVFAGLASRAGFLQISKGEDFYIRSQENHLRLQPLASERGIIYDRTGKQLTWNILSSSEIQRIYIDMPGLSHVLGYMGYLSEIEADDNINFMENKYGKFGIEKEYDEFLRGYEGSRLVEVNSMGDVISESVQKTPKSGASVILSIDADMQSKLFEVIGRVAEERGFFGGAGSVVNINTGEVLALVSWPEFNSTDLSSGDPKQLDLLLKDTKNPFFFRAISGLYPPGSVMKPMIALGALQEGIINKDKQIFSSGSISIENPYNPSEYSVFYDWKAHGFVDLKRAIAVSSNVYFYTIGGGFGDIDGLGISKIKEYTKMFGLGEYTNIDIGGEKEGFIPDPLWKLDVEDDIWRVGDTYNVSIGQGGVQVTPIQMSLVAATIASNGVRVVPYIVEEVRDEYGSIIYAPDNQKYDRLAIAEEHFDVVKKGMRMAVTSGTASAISGLGVSVAGKTGTAEIGSGKFVNSWFIGFAPYENPKFAFAVVMERGSAKNLVGALYVVRQLLEWIVENRPEYF